MAHRTTIYIILVLFFLMAGRVNVSAEVFVQKDNVEQNRVLPQIKWQEVYRWVASDENVPERQNVLILIRHHFGNFERLEKLVRYLDGGKPYAYITKHVLPRICKWKATQEPLSNVGLPLPAETLPALEIKPESIVPATVTVEEKEERSSSKTVLALKNNLLYDLALAPNIEIELPVGRRWSLNAEYKCPWWSDSGRGLCYQLLSGGVEVRCWLGDRRTRNQLTGHFFGAYAEGGKYDFQFKEDKGFRGQYYAASGLTYGYSHQVAKHLAFEFSLGVGYLDTKYRKYTAYKGDLIWTNSGRYHFIGPTKAKISLVWLITGRR